MINEFPEKHDQLEAELEQQDMFFMIDRDDPDFGDYLTEYYSRWRRDVRLRGFRYFNMLSDKDSRVITIMFRRVNQ